MIIKRPLPGIVEPIPSGAGAATVGSGSGGSSGEVVHNDTTEKQGGTTDQYYHLTSAEYSALGDPPSHNSTTGKQGGTTGEYYHLTAAQLAAIQSYALIHDSIYVAGSSAKTVSLTAGYIVPIDLSGATGGALNGNVVVSLPITAAVGDRCGFVVYAASGVAGSFAVAPGYAAELNDASINGVAHTKVTTGSSKWGLWLPGEVLIFYCINATGPSWIVEHDGRICFNCHATSAGVAANSAATPTSYDLDGALLDNAGMLNSPSNTIVVKRAGIYMLSGKGLPNAAIADQEYYGCGWGTASGVFTQRFYSYASAPGGGIGGMPSHWSHPQEFSANTSIYPLFVSQSADRGLLATTGGINGAYFRVGELK